MKFDFEQIINIKSKTHLNKFNIHEPLFYNNYLFHYLIIFDKFDILQLDTFPIYKENEEGLNGFFLAAKYDNIKILKYLINNYKQYIYNRNQDDEMFTDYLKYSSIFEDICIVYYYQRYYFENHRRTPTIDKLIKVHF